MVSKNNNDEVRPVGGFDMYGCLNKSSSDSGETRVRAAPQKGIGEQN